MLNRPARNPMGRQIRVIVGMCTLTAPGWLAAAESAPATAPVATVIAVPPVAVYRDPGRYNSFPDIERLPDGRLLCVFRDATFPDRVRHIEADARIVGSISTDEGRSWSKPVEIYDSPACQNDPSIVVLRDGRILLTFFNWIGRSADYVAEHKPPYARRVDRGEWGAFAEPGGVHRLWGQARTLTWEKEATLTTGSNTILRATSSAVLETRGGTLLLPFYGRSQAEPCDQAYVLHSTDGGKSWSDAILLAADPDKKVAMQEPGLVETAEGHIVALLRTSGAEDHLYMTRSTDDGRRWAPAQRTDLIGHPPEALRLPDNRLLVVYGYRHKPFGVRACVSPDGGRTWDRGRELVITATGEHGDLGYPSACLTGDGHVVVVYYMNGAGTRDRWIESKRIPLTMLR
ncbi:MAG: exo-alpha-sialidase [Phycisphaerae bacterium]|nr:exo-alpha-sialidase [Phycisphaerae bacterium]